MNNLTEREAELQTRVWNLEQTVRRQRTLIFELLPYANFTSLPYDYQKRICEVFDIDLEED